MQVTLYHVHNAAMARAPSIRSASAAIKLNMCPHQQNSGLDWTKQQQILKSCLFLSSLSSGLLKETLAGHWPCGGHVPRVVLVCFAESEKPGPTPQSGKCPENCGVGWRWIPTVTLYILNSAIVEDTDPPVLRKFRIKQIIHTYIYIHSSREVGCTILFRNVDSEGAFLKWTLYPILKSHLVIRQG
jgi:hypothetical protein